MKNFKAVLKFLSAFVALYFVLPIPFIAVYSIIRWPAYSFATVAVLVLITVIIQKVRS